MTRFQDLDYCDKDQVAGCESCYGGTPATIGSEEYSSALMVRAKCCIVFPCRISGFRLSLKNARNRLKDRRLINQKLRIAVGSCFVFGKLKVGRVAAENGATHLNVWQRNYMYNA